MFYSTSYFVKIEAENTPEVQKLATLLFNEYNSKDVNVIILDEHKYH